MKYSVLIAEDNKAISDVMKLYLESDEIKVRVVEDGECALKAIREEKIDIIVADIMMPKMDGYQLTKRIREEQNIPIIIVSAKEEVSDKILGFNMGADDYITKPFNPLEFVIRVKAQLRRFYELGGEGKKPQSIKKYRVGELVLNDETFNVTVDGKEVKLTAGEFKILRVLMQQAGKIFTKEEIIEEVSGDGTVTDEKTIMVQISNIRNKIGDDSKNPKYIKTVRGLGYKIG